MVKNATYPSILFHYWAISLFRFPLSFLRPFFSPSFLLFSSFLPSFLMFISFFLPSCFPLKKDEISTTAGSNNYKLRSVYTRARTQFREAWLKRTWHRCITLVLAPRNLPPFHRKKLIPCPSRIESTIDTSSQKITRIFEDEDSTLGSRKKIDLTQT